MKTEVALIPAAGRGTRMRPATNAVPKALLTVVDRPSIQWVVEEAARAGVREAVVVVDPEAQALVERHFRMIEDLPELGGIGVRTVVQSEARGLGHAVAAGREEVGERPFFVMTADDLIRPDQEVLPRLAEASDGGSVLCLRRLPEEALSAKGVVVPGAGAGEAGRALEVAGAVEKPPAGEAPSRLAIQGRYLFTPEVFDRLEGAEPGYGGEIQLTDAIDALGRRGRCRGYVTGVVFLDTGHARGFLEANLALASASADYGEDAKAMMKRMLEG